VGVRRLAVPLLAVLLLTGCVKRVRPAEVPLAPPRASGATVVALARSFIGTPYRNGGTDPGGFDCSGLVQYVFAQIGVGLPRSAPEQASAGEHVDLRDVRDGDLVFFAIDGRTISHVGIVAGPGTFVHAPNSRGQVREESLGVAYWQSRFVEARSLVR
jgi:cell wall-associated NlpC family hydrolase